MSVDHNPSEAGKGITALFVRRPVLAFVINALIVVAGLAAFAGIEIRELPDVDRPVVTVNTTFNGAAAETVDREITAQIEGAVARVPGLQSISSSSSFGRSRVTIEMSESVDLDVAASDIRDAVSRIVNQLPEDADEARIVKADANADAIMRLAVTADDMAIEDLSLLVDDEIVDALSAVPGVADVQIYGDREKLFNVDIDQNKLASLGLTVADLSGVLNTVSFERPAGELETRDQALVVRAISPVQTPEDFENLIIKDNVRLRDVATVIFSGDPGSSSLRTNGKTGVGLGIIRQAQSNTLDISEGVRATVAQLQETLPEGIQIGVSSDDAVFIQGAIHEVEIALVLAVSLVLVIIYIFLRDWRATLIPGLAMPVSLIGTLATIYLTGFSLNILTLLALVLATGLVVDDAIVVLENVVRRRNEGMGPRAAAVLGTQEVFFAVLATTATLAAVFIPISFLPGQTGGLFREFGFVLAMSVLISSIVALSLCPMLASRFMKEAPKEHRGGALGTIGGKLGSFYARTLRFALNMPWLIVAIAAIVAVVAFMSFGLIRQELTPTEDRSMILMRLNAPQGVSLDYTTDQIRKVEAILQPYRDSGEIVSIFANGGSGGNNNSAFMVLGLAPWGERERSQQEIAQEINRRVSAALPGIRAFTMQPNSLGIRGAGSGLQFAIVGASYDRLNEIATAVLAEMEKDNRFDRPRRSVDPTQPQLSVTVDRERASDLGINITNFAESLQSLLDGREVVDVYIGDRSYPVKLVSTSHPINDPTDLENIFLLAKDGRFVPVSSIATLREIAVPPQLAREEQVRAVAITAGLSGDFALGEALATARSIADEHMGPGYRIIPLAEAKTLGETNSAMFAVFGFALIIILLVLAAQFESFISALIIMVTVPLGLACAVFALLWTNTSLNAYSQIGLVLLIGVMSKNGILIVEFANQLRDKGASVREAIEQAATIRLRPVMMTMICTILGGLPLILATGAGAEARIALGWVIVGGLGLATISTLYLTPVAYLLIARFAKPAVEEEARLKREMQEAAYLNVEPAE